MHVPIVSTGLGGKSDILAVDRVASVVCGVMDQLAVVLNAFVSSPQWAAAISVTPYPATTESAAAAY